MLEILRCPNCMQRYASGARVCTHCGFSLANHGKTKTQTMDAFVKEIDIPTVRGTAEISNQTVLSFAISHQSVMIPLVEQVVLGRCSDSSDTQPDIDLEPFAALSHGVSRRHLLIKVNGNRVYVTDMDSRNGTWLNGTKLDPFVEHMLCDNDQLRLGSLYLKVSFKQAQHV